MMLFLFIKFGRALNALLYETYLSTGKYFDKEFLG